jgi:hypothetical protein
MSEESKGSRPSQVTMAGWTAAVASALTVLTLFDSVSRLHTVEYREGIEDLLATPPYDGLGVELAQVVEMMRGAMFVSAAVAAATVILAIYVLKRHNAARIGITVAAVLLVLTAPFGGGPSAATSSGRQHRVVREPPARRPARAADVRRGGARRDLRPGPPLDAGGLRRPPDAAAEPRLRQPRRPGR